MKEFFNGIDGDGKDDGNGKPPLKNEPSPEGMARISGLIKVESNLIEKKVNETTDDRPMIFIGKVLAPACAMIAFFATILSVFFGLTSLAWVTASVTVVSIAIFVASYFFDWTEEMREQMSRELMAKNGADPRLQFARTIIDAHSAWVTLKGYYQSVYAAVCGDLGYEGDKIADACFVLLGDGNKSISRAIAIFLLKEDSKLFGRNDGTHDEVGFGTHVAELTAFVDVTRTSDFGRQLINAAVKAQV
jgi:hypothetical protein